MATGSQIQELVNQKLAAFEQLQPEFEASFCFVQAVHGQQRFTSFPVADSVRYLHALWVCECKDRLLSIYKNIARYEGRYCLELLRRWQEGETADVVEFLHRKLDPFPFAQVTRQIQEARHQHAGESLVRRLWHGRLVLLNRAMNLVQAFDSIFSLSDEELLSQVQAACARYGHTPAQIEQQEVELDSPIYAYVPHQRLAQRNIAVMNKLGVDVMTLATDKPGERSPRVREPTGPPGPFAEQVIEGYVELTLPEHNNLRRQRIVDFPERSDAGIV